ncbi:6315_t:CDS:2, partial [Acaulospora colombiana]
EHHRTESEEPTIPNHEEHENTMDSEIDGPPTTDTEADMNENLNTDEDMTIRLSTPIALSQPTTTTKDPIKQKAKKSTTNIFTKGKTKPTPKDNNNDGDNPSLEPPTSREEPTPPKDDGKQRQEAQCEGEPPRRKARTTTRPSPLTGMEKKRQQRTPPKNRTHLQKRKPTPHDKNQTELIPLDDVLAADEATADENFGAFFIPKAPYEETNAEEPEGPSSKTKKKREWIQWIPIRKEGLDPSMLHHSGNNLDYMREELIRELDKAQANLPNTLLPTTAAAIINKGYKILARVVGFDYPEEAREDWIKHAVRSALDSAGVSLDSARALLPFKKPGYDWVLLRPSKEAYDILKPLRGLLDPRSRALVLFRDWDMNPPTSQTFSVQGIISMKDDEKTKEASMRRLKT